MMHFNLRKIKGDDIDLIFNWVNEEEVRSNSINTDSIPFDEHKAWFDGKINSTDCVYFIMEVNNEPAGQIRFDYNYSENAWEIAYMIAKEFRGQGLSKNLVKEGIRELNKFPLIAYVKEENARSKSVFAFLQFSDEGHVNKRNTRLIKYMKKSL